MSHKCNSRGRVPVLALLVFASCLVSRVNSQTFNSGSTGADGTLTLTTPGDVVFDPKSYNPPLNASGDNVFHFSTITIGSGVRLILSGRIFTAPVYFLATGVVKIDGGIYLSGEEGHPETNIGSVRVPSVPGPGGYPGGVGGSSNNSNPASSGSGPGGGAAGVFQVSAGRNGSFAGSTYLIPLTGGSGGGGGARNNCSSTYAGGGGAGGGALVIASSVSIIFSRTTESDGIYANGGSPGCGAGWGSGGAIRLVAPIISGTTTVETNRNDNGLPGGLIRLEAFELLGAITRRGPNVASLPNKVLTPAAQGQPSIQVTSINGVAINANPFTFPDLVINSASAVTVNVQAQLIPVGTVPKILVYSEFGPDQSVDCSALQGTFQQSTCSASVPFPTGGSRGFVKAIW